MTEVSRPRRGSAEGFPARCAPDNATIAASTDRRGPPLADAMSFPRRLPALLALIVLGAHAVRAGLPPALAVILTVALIAMLVAARPGLLTAVAAALGAGAILWVRVLWVTVNDRLAEGRPWTRLAAILGAVTVFTVAAAWLIRPSKASSAPPDA